jgi:hypothetical protein
MWKTHKEGIMKLSLSQLYGAANAIARLDSVVFPGPIAFQVLTFVDAAREELIKLEKVRISLVKKYGIQTDKNRDEYQVKPENLEKFAEEFSSTLANEVELPDLELSKSSLMEANLSSSDLRALSFLIKKDSSNVQKTSTENKN